MNLAALTPFPDGIGALFNGMAILVLMLVLSQHMLLMLRSIKLRARVRKLPHPVKSLRQLRECMEPLGRDLPSLSGPCTHVRRSAEVISGRLVLNAAPAAVFPSSLLRQTRGPLVLPGALLDRVPWLLAIWGLIGSLVALTATPQSPELAASPLVWGLLTGLTAALFGGMALGASQGAIRSLVSWLEEGSTPSAAAAALSHKTGTDLMAQEPADPEERQAMLSALTQLGQSQQLLSERIETMAAQHMESMSAQIAAAQSVAAQSAAAQSVAAQSAAGGTPAPLVAPALDLQALEAAFGRALKSELGPALALSSAQAPLGGSSHASVDSEALAQAVIAGLDGAIGDSLRSTAQLMDQVSKSQRSALGDWRDSVVGLTDLIQQLEQAGKSLAAQSVVIAGASAPSLKAAETSLRASEELARIVPALETARAAWQGSQEGVSQATAALSAGTQSYQDAGALVQEIVTELRQAQREASVELKQAARESTALIKAEMDHALVASMKEAGNQLRRFAERQEQGLDSWESATTSFGKTVDKLSGITGDLRDFSAGLSAATEPSLEAGRALKQAALTLEKTVPSIEAAARAQTSAQQSMQTAADALQSGTEGYLSAATVVKELVTELRVTHEMAIERIATGIDQAVGESLMTAGSRIEAVSQAQAQHLQAWTQTLREFTPAVQTLRGAAGDLDAVVLRFQQAAEPAATAAVAFQQAAGIMGKLVPKMDETARSYEGMNMALVRAARQLTESSRAYAEAGGDVAELVTGLQDTLRQQVEGNKAFLHTVGQATVFIEALGPASQSVKSAARELEEASTHTAEVVHALKDTIIVQGKAVTHMRDSAGGMVEAMASQRAQWERLMKDMDKLQDTMSMGVDTFSEKLPLAIDSTLVHFDAALGEGVERMGSSIERLRESMDDLQERLESLMSDKRRR